jgi:hypothetical protein
VSAGLSLRAATIALASLCGAGAAAASSDPSKTVDEPAPTMTRALSNGELAIDLRYRFEFVDSESFDKKAYASTLRGALAYETAPFHGFAAGVTFEAITPIGNDLLYNNAGAGSLWNGVTDRPVVADPAIVEVDRIWLRYQGPRDLDIRVGRFAYTLDNQRFVGIAPWRQNYRSFSGTSGASWTWSPAMRSPNLSSSFSRSLATKPTPGSRM